MFRTLLAVTLLMLATISHAGVYPRIIGGSDATGGEFPFIAALVRSDEPNDYQAQFCGGTVIAARWILTAAHCVDGVTPASVQIITGVTTLADMAPFAARTTVSAIVPHPQFDEDRLANDLALLYLATPVTTSAGFSIDDGTTLGALAEGADLTAIGWGIIDQGMSAGSADDLFSATLQKATLDYISYSRCNSLYYSGSLHASALCAGFLSGPPRDSCFGDSGGPLMAPLGGGNWRQVGITSYGASNTCALSTEPGVYVNVGGYRNFITDAQSKPDVRVNLSTVAGSDVGIKLRMRAGVSNASPANSAAGTTLAITVTGDVALTNIVELTGCTSSVTGTGTGKSTTLSCTLGTLAASTSDARELALELYGHGPYAVAATASSTSGDYYTPNNTAGRDYELGAAVPAASSNAGSLPVLTLLTLLVLTARRRYAPNHSLRLRQLLRLG